MARIGLPGSGTGRPRIAVVVPCYRVRAQIDAVLETMPPEVDRIYCVDDACPEDSGAAIAARWNDHRVVVLRHAENQGVGGAVITGYRQALADGAEIVVKIDGDGQMDPRLLPRFVEPIRRGACDYTKGNRFYRIEDVRAMPRGRLIGNAALSFLSKLSSGYWPIFDPTNGYTAIHAAVLRLLPLERLHRRYFFETDMLFRLSTLRAVVTDVPMTARYGTETSSLRLGPALATFFAGHLRNTAKRIFYAYILRDFSIASALLLVGGLLFVGGGLYGAGAWISSVRSGIPATAGEVMIAALPILAGLQMLLSALQYDIQNVPSRPIHPVLIADLPAPADTTPPSARTADR